MEIYTVEQVAEMLSVRVYTIREWLRTGKLHGHKIGSLWRITRANMDELMETTKVTVDTPANQILPE